MAFCEDDDVYKLLVGVDKDTITGLLIDRLIPIAESTIRGALSSRYDLSATRFNTSTSTPPLVRSICEEYVEALYYSKNSRGGETWIKLGMDNLKRLDMRLSKISKGEVHIYDSTGSVIPNIEDGSFAMTSTTNEYTETFNEDAPTAWAVDPDKLDDIASGRS